MTNPSEGQRATMEGHGSYNANSALQASGAAVGLALFAEAASEVPLDDSEGPVVLADYGSSQGRNSLAPIRGAIAELRSRLGPQRPIIVAHVDQPANDFGTLFEVVDTTPASYASDDGNVFPCAVGRSFYRSVLPPDYVHLGWSSYAAQWLSREPVRIPGHIYMPRATGDVRAAIAERARSDWESFLSLRSLELHSGGCLIVVTPALDDSASTPIAVLFDYASQVLAEMVAEGALNQEERERMVVSAYQRTRVEALAPFADGHRFAGLSMRSCTVSQVPDPSWPQFERDRDSGALAARRAAFFRATFAPTLSDALNHRDADARKAFCDRLEAALRQHLHDHVAPIASFAMTLSLVKD
jgi:hypothetical protein